MARSMKMLIVLLATVLAAALAAPLALAGNFTSSSSSTSLVAGQVGVHRIVFDVGVAVCVVVHFTGTISGTTVSQMTLSPSYTECAIEGLFNITVSVNGCDHVFYVSSAASEGTMDYAGCNVSVPYIQFGSVGTCRVRVPEQSGKVPIYYEEVGNDLKLTTEFELLGYTESGIFCAGTGGVNGSYTGLSEVTGNGGSAALGVES